MDGPIIKPSLAIFGFPPSPYDPVKVYCVGIIGHGPKKGEVCRRFIGVFRTADGTHKCSRCKTINRIKVNAA